MSADLRLAGAAIGCWLTALACLFCPAWSGWVTGVGALALAVIWARLPTPVLRPTRWVVVAALLGIACGAVATAARVGERDAEPLAGLAAGHRTVRVGLRVSDDPRLGRSTAGRAPTVIVAARLTWLRMPDETRVELGARVLVLASDRGWLGLLPGQRVEATGRLSPADGGDLRAAIVSVPDAPAKVSPAPVVQRAAGTLRAGLQRACRPLPAEPGGLLPGLVVGDTSRLDQQLTEDFRATGLTHLTAVSGANLAIMVGLVLTLARWCRAGPKVAALICVLTLAGFVVLVRPSPSVLRAAAMGGLALVALSLGRPRAVLPSLATGVLVLVVTDPELAVDAGFALSVLATGGLVLLAPRWAEALKARGWPAPAAEAVCVPAAAQAACAPVIAAISGGISLTTVPANLLAAPAVAPATVLGIIAAVSSPVLPGLAEFTAWVAAWPARWLVTIAHYGAAVPDGVLPWPGGAFGGLLLGGLLAVLLVAFRRPVVRRLVLVVSVAGMLGAVPVRLLTGGWPPPGWVLVACDVGQGDALVVAAGGHDAIVVDTGPQADPVDRCLRDLGVQRIPLLIISHFHVDHIGGLDGVLRRRRVDRLLVPPFAEPASGRKAVLSRGLTNLDAPTGSTLTVGPVGLTILGPARAVTGTRSDVNNNSLVIAITVRGLRLLLTGDAETEEQLSLLTAPLHADVLKVAHHGSAYQDPAFLDAVAPRVALVSVGAGNDYGHPSPVVLARLARSGARVARTDEQGDIAVVLDSAGRLTVVAHGPATAG